jgi:hypothetical protein
MEARIKKLVMEQEKAKRRILEAKRQQEFVMGIKMSKQTSLDERVRFNEQLKLEEMKSRSKINEEKNK